MEDDMSDTTDTPDTNRQDDDASDSSRDLRLEAALHDNFGITEKVAVVSGGGAAGDGIGNGRASAILLARAGAKVLVVDRELPLAQKTADMINDIGGTALAHAADVTIEADCKAIAERAMDDFGRLDLLDNNVGISSRGSVVEEDPATWRRRRHRQRFIDLRPAPPPADRLHDLQGRRDRPDPCDGNRSRPGRHSRQLRGPRTGLHTYGRQGRHGRNPARPTPV